MTEPQKIHLPMYCLDLVVDPSIKNVPMSFFGQLHLEDPARLDASCTTCHAPGVIQGFVYATGLQGIVKLGYVLECQTCISLMQHRN